MAYLIGTDEAGYGPNLGPLVISASLWRVPDDLQNVDLYQRLAQVITANTSSDEKRIAIADSKQLYKPRGTMKHLERGLLAMLALLDRRPADWQAVWEVLSADREQERLRFPWYATYNEPLPLEVQPALIHAAEESLRTEFQQQDVELLELRSQVLFPRQFNSQVDSHGNKGIVLSRTTLGLLASIMPEPCDGPVTIVCDKHGGRNRYQPLLQDFFPESLIEVHGESRAGSVYRWGPSRARREVRFVVGGESFMPSALASMACKYLRELAMRAFNRFWCEQVPQLRPTAGYPLDAKRFKREIAQKQQELSIEDHDLWRKR